MFVIGNNKLQKRDKKNIKATYTLTIKVKHISILSYSLPDFPLCYLYIPHQHISSSQKEVELYMLLCNLLFHLNILQKCFRVNFKNLLHYHVLLLHKIPLLRCIKFYIFCPKSGCLLSFITINSSNKHPSINIWFLNTVLLLLP